MFTLFHLLFSLHLSYSLLDKQENVTYMLRYVRMHALHVYAEIYIIRYTYIFILD